MPWRVQTGERPAGTQHLIDDIEALRMPHGVDRWLVFARV
jgi:hypothetical protein